MGQCAGTVSAVGLLEPQTENCVPMMGRASAEAECKHLTWEREVKGVNGRENVREAEVLRV